MKKISLIILCSVLVITLTGCGNNSSGKAVSRIKNLVTSNDSDINSQLSAYGGSPIISISNVSSANCQVKDNDEYGRYILLCSFQYQTTSGDNGNRSVYAGYMANGDDNFYYEFASTYYSDVDAMSSLKEQICWNQDNSNFNCN